MTSNETTGPAPILPPETYEVEEVAAILHVHKATVFRRMREGTLRRVKVGARTLIRRDDLEAMLQDQSRRGLSGALKGMRTLSSISMIGARPFRNADHSFITGLRRRNQGSRLPK